jgi:hypothetical protein
LQHFTELSFLNMSLSFSKNQDQDGGVETNLNMQRAESVFAKQEHMTSFRHNKTGGHIKTLV